MGTTHLVVACLGVSLRVHFGKLETHSVAQGCGKPASNDESKAGGDFPRFVVVYILIVVPLIIQVPLKKSSLSEQ